MDRRSQMARIIEAATLIHNAPRQWTRQRLADRFGVSIATISRDIKRLCEMGLEVVPYRKQGYEMVSDFFLPALNLNFQEALALVIAANFYRATEGNAAVEVINSAIDKITAALPQQTHDTLKQIAPQIEVPHQQVSEIDETHQHREHLYRAIREKHKVDMVYNSFSSQKQVRHRVSPYAVFFRKHGWYLIGRSEVYKRIRTFRINRIVSLSITESGYQIPEGFSAEKHLAKSWDVRLGLDTRVVVLFTERIAPLIREVGWHPTQQLREEKGVLRFEVTVAGWKEIGWWILSWGDDAAVVKPKALREWLVQTAQKMVELYGGGNTEA